MEVLVGRKERMWHKSGSGRVLNLSVAPPVFASSFCRLEVNSGDIALLLSFQLFLVDYYSSKI